MDIVLGLSIVMDEKGKRYNSILFIVNCFLKMVYYKLVKVTINAARFAKIIIDMVTEVSWATDVNNQ